MRERTSISIVLGLAVLLGTAEQAEAGPFWRWQQPRQNAVVAPSAVAPYGTPVYYYYYYDPASRTYYYAPASVPVVRATVPQTSRFTYGPGHFGYNGDPPTPANGWGYGLPAAGYGSAYPAHPEGPGWPNYP